MKVEVSRAYDLYVAYYELLLHSLHGGRQNKVHVALPPYTAHSIHHCVRQL